MTLPIKFWTKVRKTDYCWIWQAAVNGKGYGCFAVDGKSELVHRLAYTDLVGRIPRGLTIDHTCRVRNCVNPDHLEAVTAGENTRRGRRANGLSFGGRCPSGHLLTDENAYRHRRGQIECRQCSRDVIQMAREMFPEAS